jgi:hypothetical protein
VGLPWEFTSDEVHGAVRDSKDNESVYRREKSVPFDSKRLCRDLALGDMLKIRDNQGPGKPVRFALTDHDDGERTSEILVKTSTDFHQPFGGSSNPFWKARVLVATGGLYSGNETACERNYQLLEFRRNVSSRRCYDG